MKTYSSPKTGLLAWLAIPILMAWLASSYLLGVARRPAWQDRDTQTGGQVLAAQDPLLPQTTTKENVRFAWQNTGLVTLWFDDGWLSEYTVAAPILKQKNFPAAIAITTDLIGYDAYMTWGQVKRLYHHYNWEITAHSRVHDCNPDKFTEEKLASEVQGSYIDLINQGIDVDTYVLPCGASTPAVIKKVKSMYVAMRDSGSVLNPIPLTDPYAMHAFTITDKVPLSQVEQQLAQAAAEKQWLILMFHQIDDQGGEYSLHPDTFKTIIEQIAASGLPVVTPNAVLQITQLSQ